MNPYIYTVADFKSLRGLVKDIVPTLGSAYVYVFSLCYIEGIGLMIRYSCHIAESDLHHFVQSPSHIPQDLAQSLANHLGRAKTNATSGCDALEAQSVDTLADPPIDAPSSWTKPSIVLPTEPSLEPKKVSRTPTGTPLATRLHLPSPSMSGLGNRSLTRRQARPPPLELDVIHSTSTGEDTPTALPSSNSLFRARRPNAKAARRHCSEPLSPPLRSFDASTLALRLPSGLSAEDLARQIQMALCSAGHVRPRLAPRVDNGLHGQPRIAAVWTTMTSQS